jgi:hypothetical protein
MRRPTTARRTDPARVDWYVERAFSTEVAPRAVKKLTIYRLGRRYTRTGLPAEDVPAASVVTARDLITLVRRSSTGAPRRG